LYRLYGIFSWNPRKIFLFKGSLRRGQAATNAGSIIKSKKAIQVWRVKKNINQGGSMKKLLALIGTVLVASGIVAQREVALAKETTKPVATTPVSDKSNASFKNIEKYKGD
jgi:hypothetical protein